MQHELQTILSGKSPVEFGTIREAATDYVRKSKSSSRVVTKS